MQDSLTCRLHASAKSGRVHDAFDIVGVMRERTPLAPDIPVPMPQLELIASTADRNASINLAAPADYRVEVTHKI